MFSLRTGKAWRWKRMTDEDEEEDFEEEEW